MKSGTAHATAVEVRKAAPVGGTSAGKATQASTTTPTERECSGVVNDRGQPYAVAGHKKNFVPKFKGFTRCDACPAFYRARVADGSITPPVRSITPD